MEGGAIRMRTNLTMSDEMSDWYGVQAAKMGVSKNAMMQMALKAYMDNQKAMEAQQDVRKLLGQFQSVMEMAKELGMPVEGGPVAMIQAAKAAGEEAQKEVNAAMKRKKAKPSST